MAPSLTREQSLRRSALWEDSAAEALAALRALGIWEGHDPNIRVARKAEGLAGLAPARWAKSAKAKLERSLSTSARSCPDRAAAAYANAVSALALCGPERALVVPQRWVDGPPGLPGWSRSEADFRLAICAHELAHLALDHHGEAGQAAERALALAGPEGAFDARKALWPRNEDDELAALQARWRAQLLEGFADCAACLACERAGLGRATDFASALARARQANISAWGAPAGEIDHGKHDTRDALACLAELLESAADRGASELCAAAAREGLARSVQAEARRHPLGETALLASVQGAMPTPRKVRP